MPSPDRVSLPSINEMFPEHMMASWYPPPDPVASSSSSPPALAPPPSGLDVKTPAPALAALPPLVPPPPLHNALRVPASPRSHAKPFDERARPVFRVQIPAPAVYAPGYADAAGYRPREGGGSSSGEEKKHCCPHCHKRCVSLGVRGAHAHVAQVQPAEQPQHPRQHAYGRQAYVLSVCVRARASPGRLVCDALDRVLCRRRLDHAGRHTRTRWVYRDLVVAQPML
ncbi:hypothetical protein PHLGIDRAFT_472271 [Phlebiopsis gigantea 11061_1 CR5-6]|uniref:Uncharacterized protein n=1 Tax=Phlebiopsis gigantea (strain 11061_1 CR5-6) TaxID=745531 RepID=A0A0C3PJ40_PHLG1|nr:hypothetical protein PHLGIDRAFT_472271 [Phlebiopsis gigantea 11061_1 CR5-6]